MNRSYPESLGWELFNARGPLGQHDVAHKLEINQSALSNWENGNRVPTLPFLVRLVNNGYGLCVQDLLIRAAAGAVWNPDVTLLKVPEGLEILRNIPKEQVVLSAFVAHDLGSHIPRTG